MDKIRSGPQQLASALASGSPGEFPLFGGAVAYVSVIGSLSEAHAAVNLSRQKDRKLSRQISEIKRMGEGGRLSYLGSSS